MTLRLPRPNVQINPGRLGPPRLTPKEEEALAGVSDTVLRKVLGEMFLAARGNQENFDRLAQEFPIQGPNLNNDVVEVGEEGEPGQILGLDEKGNPQWENPPKEYEPPPGEIVTFGELEIYEDTWPIEEGETSRKLYVPVTVQPTAALAIILSKSNLNAAIAATPGTFTGHTADAAGFSATSGNLPSVIMSVYGRGSGTVGSFILARSPRRWNLTRTAEVAKTYEAKIWLVLVGTRGLIEREVGGGGPAGKEEKGVIEAKTEPFTRDTEFSIAIYRRNSEKLPTAISDVGRSVLTEGPKGAATGGFQIYFPTEAEKKAGATHTFKWTFPDEGKAFSTRTDPYALV